MNDGFLQNLKLHISNANPSLLDSDNLEFKNVFGAVGGYVNGNLFITCGKFGVALKLPSVILAALFEDDDVKQLRYFPKGHVKKEYAVIPKRIYNNSPEFRIIMDKSIEYAKHR